MVRECLVGFSFFLGLETKIGPLFPLHFFFANVPILDQLEKESGMVPVNSFWFTEKRTVMSM